MTNDLASTQTGTSKAADAGAKLRRAAAVDLAAVIAVFLACYATVPVLDPILRHGRGLAMVLAITAYQFSIEGVAPLLIMAWRRESFSDFGFTRDKVARSLALALLLAVIFDLGMSWHSGALLWVPMRRQPVVPMSLALGFPLSLLGLALTVLSWGFIEGFFGVFFARKFNQALGKRDTGWFAPGVLAFALFNGMAHMALGQGLEGFIGSFASGYAIAVIPAVTKNAWGSALVQTLTDAVGKL